MAVAVLTLRRVCRVQGICLAPQLIDEVPVDDHDRMMDVVVTPDEVLRFRSEQ
jgi:5-formyltetrahydrofolate cyclo-ligase